MSSSSPADVRPTRVGPGPRPRSIAKQLSEHTGLSHGHQPPPKLISRASSRDSTRVISSSHPSTVRSNQSISSSSGILPSSYQEDRDRIENIEKKLDSILSYLAIPQNRIQLNETSLRLPSGGDGNDQVPLSPLPETPTHHKVTKVLNDESTFSQHNSDELDEMETLDTSPDFDEFEYSEDEDEERESDIVEK